MHTHCMRDRHMLARWGTFGMGGPIERGQEHRTHTHSSPTPFLPLPATPPSTGLGRAVLHCSPACSTCPSTSTRACCTTCTRSACARSSTGSPSPSSSSTASHPASPPCPACRSGCRRSRCDGSWSVSMPRARPRHEHSLTRTQHPAAWRGAAQLQPCFVRMRFPARQAALPHTSAGLEVTHAVCSSCAEGPAHIICACECACTHTPNAGQRQWHARSCFTTSCSPSPSLPPTPRPGMLLFTTVANIVAAVLVALNKVRALRHSKHQRIGAA